MSNVYFKSAENVGPTENQIDQIIDLFPRISPVREGDLVAVKIHPGEYGNTTHMPPILVRTIAMLIKEAGATPFITDTTVLYKSRRFNAADLAYTAAWNGFSHAGMEAPFICADGLRGDDGVCVDIDGSELSHITVASAIAKADCMIMLSHCKGHPASGFGGALKNLGMGCLDKAGKALVHKPQAPEVHQEKCVGCMECLSGCPWDALYVEQGRVMVDYDVCKGDLSCVESCKSGAIISPVASTDKMQARLGEAALGPVKLLKGRIGYLNWIYNLTPGCDCFNFSAPAFAKDIGILASKDPVAIDMASIDLINSNMQHGSVRHISGVWGIDPLIHVNSAARLGAGDLRYDLERV